MYEKADSGIAAQVHLQLCGCSTQPAHCLALAARTRNAMHSPLQCSAQEEWLGLPACPGHQQLSSEAHEHTGICGASQIRRGATPYCLTAAQQKKASAPQLDVP